MSQVPSRGGFIRQARTLYVGLFGPLLLTMPTTILLARGLGPADKGAWSILLQAYFLLEQLSALGAGAFYVVALNSGRRLSDVFGTGLAQALVVPRVAFLGLAIVVGRDALPNEIGHGGAYITMGVSLILLVVGRHLMFMEIGLGRPELFVAAGLAQALVQLLAVLAFYILGQLDLTTTLGAFCLGAGARAAIPLLHLAIKDRPRLSIDKRIFVESFRFGWRRSISDIEDSVNTRIPLLLLPVFVSFGKVGVYSVALGLFEILGQAGMAVALAGLRDLAKDRSRSAAVYVHATVALGAILAVIGIPASFLIAPIFGSSYSPAAAYLLVLLPSVPVLALNRMLSAALAARGSVSSAARGGLVSIVTITVSVAALTPLLGVHGASIGLTAGLSAQAIFLLNLVSKHEGVRVRFLLLPRWQDFHDAKVAITASVTSWRQRVYAARADR